MKKQFKFDPAAYASDFMFFYPFADKPIWRNHLKFCARCGCELTGEERFIGLGVSDNEVMLTSVCEEHSKPEFAQIEAGTSLPAYSYYPIEERDALDIWRKSMAVATEHIANEHGFPFVIQGLNGFWFDNRSPNNRAVLFTEEGLTPIYWVNDGKPMFVVGESVLEAEQMEKEVKKGTIKAHDLRGMRNYTGNDPKLPERLDAACAAGQRMPPKGAHYSWGSK